MTRKVVVGAPALGVVAVGIWLVSCAAPRSPGVDGDGKPVPEVQVNAFPDVLGGASTEGLALAGMSSVTPFPASK
jgi:hypothetical protein